MAACSASHSRSAPSTKIPHFPSGGVRKMLELFVRRPARWDNGVLQRGPLMGGTQRRSALFSYRDRVSERIKAGEVAALQ
jgi:hypothetical protein